MKSLDERGIEDPFYDRAGWPEIKARFPSAEMEDASDDIHTDRILVKIHDVTLREWFTFLMDSGWSSVSLWFGISLRSEPKDSEFAKMVDEWIAANPPPDKTVPCSARDAIGCADYTGCDTGKGPEGRHVYGGEQWTPEDHERAFGPRRR